MLLICRLLVVAPFVMVYLPPLLIMVAPFFQTKTNPPAGGVPAAVVLKVAVAPGQRVESAGSLSVAVAFTVRVVLFVAVEHAPVASTL